MTNTTLESKTVDTFGPPDADAKYAAQNAIENGHQAVAEARSSLATGVHIAQENLGSALDIAKEAAANFANSVSGAASYAGQKAEDATSTAGDAIENTVHYLKDDGLNRLASDATDLIRRNPIPAMLVGVGLGFIVSQAFSRRNS